MLRAGGHLDLFDPATYDAYFRSYLAAVEPDREGIMPLREALYTRGSA